MAYCYKEEYAVYDKDGDAFGWFDTFEEAMSYVEEQVTAVKIVLMRHYSTEYEDIWERGK